MLAVSSKEEPKDAFQQNGQSKLARPALYPFLFEFQVLFQVVGNGREVHYLVRLSESDGIYLSETHELGQGAEYRFYRTLAFALHIPALPAVDPFDVPFIFLPVVGH